MINTRFCLSSSAVLLCFLLFTISETQAQKTTINVRFGDKTVPVSGYDSSGVVFISVRDYATALSWPLGSSPERKKIEVRLPNHRVKATAGSPFLIVTELATSNSSVYQLSRSVLLLDLSTMLQRQNSSPSSRGLHRSASHSTPKLRQFQRSPFPINLNST